MRDYHDCELCGQRYYAAFAAGRKWDGAMRCSCGGSHRICSWCVFQWDLTEVIPQTTDNNYRWGPGVQLLRCPASDEVRLMAGLMGERP